MSFFAPILALCLSASLSLQPATAGHYLLAWAADTASRANDLLAGSETGTLSPGKLSTRKFTRFIRRTATASNREAGPSFPAAAVNLDPAFQPLYLLRFDQTTSDLARETVFYDGRGSPRFNIADGLWPGDWSSADAPLVARLSR